MSPYRTPQVHRRTISADFSDQPVQEWRHIVVRQAFIMAALAAKFREASGAGWRRGFAAAGIDR